MDHRNQTGDPPQPGPADESKTPAWVQGVMEKELADKRQRPWKETFGDSVDKRLDEGSEIVSTEKEGCGGQVWSVMGQSLAA